MQRESILETLPYWFNKPVGARSSLWCLVQNTGFYVQTDMASMCQPMHHFHKLMKKVYKDWHKRCIIRTAKEKWNKESIITSQKLCRDRHMDSEKSFCAFNIANYA